MKEDRKAALTDKILVNATPIFLFCLWAALSEFGLVSPLYLPSPRQVFQAAVAIGMQGCFHVGATLFRIVVGWVFGCLLGVFLGHIMMYHKWVFAVLHPIVEGSRPIPPVALLPFFILWFGFSNYGKVLLVTLGCALVMVVSTVEAIKYSNPTFIDAAMSLGADRKSLFTKVLWRAILPELAAGLRISLALSITLVIVSEFMGADYGIGYVINLAKITFSTETILLGIIVVGILSRLLDSSLRLLLRKATDWTPQSVQLVRF